MHKLIHAAAVIAVLLAASGCSYLDKLSGTRDDTVLPGTREDAIPGKSQFPDSSDAPPAPPPDSSTVDTGSAGEPATGSECPPDDPACGAASDGTFSDTQ